MPVAEMCVNSNGNEAAYPIKHTECLHQLSEYQILMEASSYPEIG
jgi:hypothetical protein